MRTFWVGVLLMAAPLGAWLTWPASPADGPAPAAPAAVGWETPPHSRVGRAEAAGRYRSSAEALLGQLAEAVGVPGRKSRSPA